MFLTFILLCPTVLGYSWWNDSWEHRVPLKLAEEIGINRTFYVMEQNLTFPRGLSDCRELRVTQCSPENTTSCSQETEVPVEVLEGDDSAWCRVEFTANITAHSFRQFYVYYGNEGAEVPDYGDYKKYYWQSYPNVTPYPLRDIDVVSEKEAYAVGGLPIRYHAGFKGKQVALKWNGTEWYEVPVFGGHGADLSAVVFSSPEMGWAFGDHYYPGYVDSFFRWNTTLQGFELYPTPIADILYDACAYSDDFIVTGGSWRDIWMWNGTFWDRHKSGFRCHVYGVDIISPTDAWGVGCYHDDRCGITHWNGSSWNAKDYTHLVGERPLCAIDCLGSSNCWAAGYNGAIVKYNGTGWNIADSPTGNSVYGIKMFSDGGWAACSNGDVLRYEEGSWFKTDKITNHHLGGCYGGWGQSIDMLNMSYGWIIGLEGTMLHRGSVSVNDNTEAIGIKLDENKKIYLGGEAKLGLALSYKNETLGDLTEDNFDVIIDESQMDFDLENIGNGSYNLVFSDLYGSLGELGKFNISVRVSCERQGKEVSGQNETSFQLLKMPVESIIVSDKDWRNVLAASTTGRPVLVGDFFNLEGLEGEVLFVGDVIVGGFDGEVYNVNNRNSLQAMFLNENKRIKVKSKAKGIFAARLAKEMNRILVFDDCDGDCLDLSDKSLEELEDYFAKETGKTNYFILANANRENSILAAQMSIYRSAFPILVDLDSISYPEPEDLYAEPFNENNRIEEVRDKVRDKIEKFGMLEEDYVFGVMPKVLIIGNEEDLPYFVLLDMGLEDFVNEPSGDDIWLKSDNFYGDLNEDGFMDLAVGRINRDLERGSWQLLNIRFFEEKENLEVGILAEYNHIGGMDLLMQGGSMMNGFLAHLNLRDKYKTERLAENRFFTTGGTMEEDLLEKIKEIILKDIDKKLFWVYTKLRFSQKLLYILLERNWVDWEIPGVPHYLEEINKSKSREFLENKGMTFFFGPGDTNKIFFYDDLGKSRDIYSNPYPGPELDLRTLDKTGFLFLDYSYSFGLDFPLSSPGLIGNSGLLHDTASRETIIYFMKSMDKGVGQALAESKNQVAKMQFRSEDGPKPKEKEYFEKILLTDPALKLTEFKAEGFFSAGKEEDYFYDSIEISPEYDGVFLGYSSVLMEPNKPIIPVYTKSMILPSGAKVKDIKVEKNQKVMEGVSLPVYRDEYYREENFSEIYPKKDWWKKERSFLDGRKEIIFSVPVIYDSENSRVTINEFVFKVEYTSKLEITDFDASSIAKGEEQNFYLTLYSEGEREAELSLRIYGEIKDELKKIADLKPGENRIKFTWNNTQNPGEYEAQVVVISDGLCIGPRALNFRILEKPNLLIQTMERFLQVWDYLGERFSRTFTAQKVELNKTGPDIRTESWAQGRKTVKRITTSDFILTITESDEKRETLFTSVSGNIIIKETLGNREEIVHGNKKVKEEFENAKKLLEGELKNIK